MKLYFFITIALLHFSSLFAQEILIKDKVTGEPVPYVNIFVEGSNAGTTANEAGIFNISYAKDDQILIFSAIGYETLKLPVKDITEKVVLNPVVFELEEMVVSNNKEHKEIKIGTFKKKDIKSGFGCGRKPWMVGRFFPYDTMFDETPYLKQIKLQTTSYIKNAKMNIRLYLPDENGKPGKFLYNENIIFTVKKGNSYPEIDISHLNIQFPESGLIIVLEWFIIEENKYEYDYTVDGSKKTYNNGLLYQPQAGALLTTSYTNSWIYSGGIWGNTFVTIDKNDQQTIYSMLAVELTLSN